MYAWDLFVARLQASNRLDLIHELRLGLLTFWPCNKVLDGFAQEQLRQVDVILRSRQLCTVMSYMMHFRFYLQECAILSIIRLFTESLTAFEDVVLGGGPGPVAIHYLYSSDID